MIAEMKKLVLIGHRADKSKLLKSLHQSKMVEISVTRNLDNTSRLNNTERKEDLLEKMSRINGAFDFLRDQAKLAEKIQEETKTSNAPYVYTPVKEPRFLTIATFNYDDFVEIEKSEQALLEDVRTLEQIKVRQNEIGAERQKLLQDNEQLALFSSVALPFSFFKNTKKTEVIFGTVPPLSRSALATEVEKVDGYLSVYDGKKAVPFVAVVLRDRAEELYQGLQVLDFVKCPYNLDLSAVQAIDKNNQDIAVLEKEAFDLLVQALDKEKVVRQLKTLYDFYLVEQAKYNALDSFATTAKTFVMEAWYPADFESTLVDILDKTSERFVYELRNPEEGEVVPTHVKSKKIVEPYEDITNMFSVPKYGVDVDPNPIMMVFYFLFFGMMMADAAYGLLLAIGGFILYKLKKPTPGKGRLILIVAMGGVSTAIWGILFGSYLGFPTPTMEGVSLALLFNPLDEPLYMLIMCFAFGFLQIIAGMAVNAYNLIKKKRIWEAISDVFSWYSLFIALGLLAVGLFIKTAPKALNYVAIVFAVLGVVMLLSGGAKGKKGKAVVRGVVGRVGKLYDAVNILSDVLSYSRLFGLALSGGVVAMVVNMICEVIAGLIGIPWVGYVVCIPIYIIGHMFNLAISTLGAYVHNSRLQYIEFFGKFYEGSGHKFVPFASQTKYTYVDTVSAMNELRGLESTSQQ